jgi:hypothetical protein
MGVSSRVHVTRRSVGLVLAAVGLAALLVSGVIVAAAESTAAMNTLEPVNTAGLYPFVPAAGADVVQPAGERPDAKGEVGGDLPGLFDGEVPLSCRVGIMITALRADAARASAWADEAGIAAADIPTYLNELTPLVLGTDTAVTEHDYRSGQATSYDAVLQRGTAVLVTDTGIPAVKCVSANPLSPPEAGKPEGYSGTAWSGFTPDTVTAIGPASASVGAFRVVDPRTGQAGDQQAHPSGGGGRLIIGSPVLGAQGAFFLPLNQLGLLIGDSGQKFVVELWSPGQHRWVTQLETPADLSNTPCTPLACSYLHDASFDPPPIRTDSDGRPVLGKNGKPQSCEPDTDTVHCKVTPGAAVVLRFTQPISVDEATARTQHIEAGGTVDPSRTYAVAPPFPPTPTPTRTTTSAPRTARSTTVPQTTSLSPTTSVSTSTTSKSPSAPTTESEAPSSPAQPPSVLAPAPSPSAPVAPPPIPPVVLPAPAITTTTVPGQ